MVLISKALRALALPALLVVLTTACPAQNASAPAAKAAGATATSYSLDPAKSKLEFTFNQAGAQNKGQFTKYTVSLTAPGGDVAAGKLDVTVDVNSLDTDDDERDGILKGEDLFDVKKFPTARYTAEKLTKTAAGFEASGKLTIRNVTRDLKVPLTFKPGAGGAQLTGRTSIKRLDFGVGQGEWKSTEWVDDQVNVILDLHLVAK
jgi:polyisoprenoid-binding protein YceI